MSFRPGNWTQPECVINPRVLSVAPHFGQLFCVALTTAPHQEHVTATPAGADAGGGCGA